MNSEWPPVGTRAMPIDVVSVQSQVVYGRVGNNVALPTLDALGFNAAADACRRVLQALELTHVARCAELLVPPVGIGIPATAAVHVETISLTRDRKGSVLA